MKAILLLLTLTLLVTSLSAPFAYCQVTKKQKTEREIAKLIARLPEVIKADNYCIKKTHGKRHLFTYVTGRPGKKQFYYVSVAEDNGLAYHNWYNFLVDAKTCAIWYDDNASDKYIPLKIWRKRKNYLGLE